MGFNFYHNHRAKAFFNVSITIMVGKGDKVLFWSNRWLHGCDVEILATNIWAAVSPHVRKKHTIRDALLNFRWVRDISHAFTVQVLL